MFAWAARTIYPRREHLFLPSWADTFMLLRHFSGSPSSCLPSLFLSTIELPRADRGHFPTNPTANLQMPSCGRLLWICGEINVTGRTCTTGTSSDGTAATHRARANYPGAVLQQRAVPTAPAGVVAHCFSCGSGSAGCAQPAPHHRAAAGGAGEFGSRLGFPAIHTRS